MLLSRLHMKAYSIARLALARADQNLVAEFAASEEAFTAYLCGGHHAVAVAAFRWLCAVLHGHDGSSDFSVVSATQLPLKKPTPHFYSMALADAHVLRVVCILSGLAEQLVANIALTRFLQPSRRKVPTLGKSTCRC